MSYYLCDFCLWDCDVGHEEVFFLNNEEKHQKNITSMEHRQRVEGVRVVPIEIRTHLVCLIVHNNSNLQDNYVKEKTMLKMLK